MPVSYRKVFTTETEEELLAMTREEACCTLTEKQRLFCEYYAASHNAVLAAKKADYSPRASHSVSWRLRQDPDVNRYIMWLKLRVSHDCHISAMDIIDKYARIAFADITDFVTIDKGRVKLVDGSKMDGQLVKSIKSGATGVSVELVDKLAALQKLERYFDIMPADWRQKIEERKVDILEQRLELDRYRSGQISDEQFDDNFMQALKETTKSVWEDDEDDAE